MTTNDAQRSSADAQQGPVEIFRTDGDVSRADSGWTYDAGSDEEMVYVPFEGVYPNKGGRMQSAWFEIPSTDAPGAYYRLTFKARTAEHCYWWLDFLDENDQSRPDFNSKVYPGTEVREYDEVVYVLGDVRKVQIAFVSKGKVEASDVRFTTATAEEAAQWCDDLCSTLPPMDFTIPPDAMAKLPKTAAALKDGTPWRVVMLGHSIMNDSFNSLFMSLVQRDWPESNLEVIPSIRGSTQCGFFVQEAEFQKYVVAKKPDMLMIMGGGPDEDLAKLIEVVRQQVGCEIVVISMPLAGDWRENAKGGINWRDLKDDETFGKYLDYLSVGDCAKAMNVAFWDMTAPCNDYVATAGDIKFTRDYVHNDDVGKQIIARVLQQYFLTAK